MTRSTVAIVLTLLLSPAPILAQADPHAGHAHAAPSAAATSALSAAPLPPNEAIPPDAEGAKAALAKSPRHGEWIDLKLADGTMLLTWVVYSRVNATIPAAEAEMKKLGRPFAAQLFEGAGHGFLRQQAGRDGANWKAAEKAWAATLTFLRERLK